MAKAAGDNDHGGSESQRKGADRRGRIGSFLCLAIGLLSVASVLCLRFPAFLTTPELRQHYDMSLLRLILAMAMVVGAGLGMLSIMLGGTRLRASIGLSALFLAMLLGGPYVSYNDFQQPRFYLGLDWLVLDLFFTGAALHRAGVDLPARATGAIGAARGLAARSGLFRGQSSADRAVPGRLEPFRP
ncbi:MAG: hypothetical protein WDN69_32285 [Aliidongia sp.]